MKTLSDHVVSAALGINLSIVAALTTIGASVANMSTPHPAIFAAASGFTIALYSARGVNDNKGRLKPWTVVGASAVTLSAAFDLLGNPMKYHQGEVAPEPGSITRTIEIDNCVQRSIDGLAVYICPKAP